MTKGRWIVEQFLIAKTEAQWENTPFPVCYRCRHYIKGEMVCAKTKEIIPEELTCDNFDLNFCLPNLSWNKD